MTKRVLLIDDDLTQRILSERIVRKCGGIEFEAAESGPIGVQKFIQVCPDLVFVDLEMPEWDGFVTLKKLKALTPSDRRVIFYAFTGHSLTSSVGQQVQGAGFDGLIQKPLRKEDFIEILGKM